MASNGSTASRLPLLIVLVVVLAAAASGAALLLRVSGEESPVLPQGTVYTEGVTGTWQRVNPLFASANPVDQDLVALIFSGLLRTGPQGDIEPDLAELPVVGEGGRTYTFTLREGLRWHDGEPITSGDVVFTIERITAPGFRGDPALSAAWSNIEVRALDERSLEMRLPEPNATFLTRVATLRILPRHLLDGLGSDELFDAAYNSAPVGSGPYRLASLTASEATLEANPSYHLGQPGISRVRIRFYADTTSLLRAFERDEIDGLFFRSLPSGVQRERIEALDGATPYEIQRAAYLVLYLNNDAAAFFQDDRVRRALSLAIDREAIVEDVLGGFATASASPVAPASWAYAAQYDAAASVDLEAAAALLDEAGWVTNAATGIRTRLGSEFRITLRTDDDPVRTAVAQAIAGQLEPLGIRATVVTTSFAVLRRDFLQERRYEAALAGWEQGLDPDPYFGWHSSQMGAAGANIANYSDAVADRLIEEGRRRHEAEVRLDMYTQLQEIWQATAPSAVIAYPHYVYVVRNSIDPELPPLAGSPADRFMDIHRWRRS